ncbi:STM4015 family protein [Micromonospora echinofusca]|uniref:Leucine-rich repeat domain-containing protein n=1 Tax=Micromonospora echinofusca TaxID=47858 RepID=A0ABS3VYA6_MICEH|nr:STM4015 family protein [Micromonospora echinofusca]MBO4209428.1 leucine-rich repeat domain-containing protein [Micromonospora echinofusca]
MTINQHVTEFAGLPVVAFDPAAALPADQTAVAWRLEAADYDTPAEEFAAQLTEFVATVDPASVRALVIGAWGSAYDTPPPVGLLVELASRLTGLRALFLGEMTFEECEISWIRQDDVTPLLTAYPALEVLRVRGATEGLTLSPVRHTALRELAIEAGGLPAGVVRAVAGCDLPALEHLELWLGDPAYGGDATVDDLAPILAGTRLPRLRHLGLRDAMIADEVAAAVAGAPVVARLHTLDLSLGVLSDPGAAALLAGQSLTHLRRLDLHHHYLSEETAARLARELPGVEVDLSDREEADSDGDRYVAVAE